MKPWQCPGPARLLNRLIDSVVQGGSSAVVLAVPLALLGIDDELVHEIGPQGWSITHVIDNGSNPARQVLAAAWVTDALAGEVDEVTIAQREDLGGRIFWCTPRDRAGVSNWLSFLDSYHVACRARPEGDWPRFVLFLFGDLAEPHPVKKTGIDVFDLGSAASRADLLLYAYHQAGSSTGYGPKTELIAQVAANLAIWDFALLEALLAEKPERLMEPMDVLRDYAIDLGWSAASASWREGSLQTLVTKDVVHSAKLALSDPMGEIPARVWAGQAAVLLPIIERRRLRLIEQNLSVLASKVPFQTTYDTVTDVFDMEIGSVWHYLRQASAANVVGKALRLRYARNTLAHMRPMTAMDAFWDELMITD